MVALVMILLTTSLANASKASVSKQAGKSYTVTATFKKANNLTVILMSATGRQLASAPITRNTHKITFKTIKTNTLNGATL